MDFSHTNSIRYKYTAGGVEADKTIAKTETGSAEINIEHEVTMGATVTADLDIPGFEFATVITTLFATSFIRRKV